MDPVKDAFSRAKQDIQELAQHLYRVATEIQDLKTSMADFIKFNQQNLQHLQQTVNQTVNQSVQQTIQEIQQAQQSNASQKLSQSSLDILKKQADILESLANELKELKLKQEALETSISAPQPTQNSNNPSNRQIFPSDKPTQAPIPTDSYSVYTGNPQESSVSTGNRGVPADSQTDRQSDQQTHKSELSAQNNGFHEISQLLTSLDTLKEEVRVKISSLTHQEMLVFSTIYQLEEQTQQVDYPLLASKLQLTESSIRDYTQKLIKKGLPIVKIKQKNKKIYLSISSDFKKIASLATIIKLRELQQSEPNRYTE